MDKTRTPERETAPVDERRHRRPSSSSSSRRGGSNHSSSRCRKRIFRLQFIAWGLGGLLFIVIVIWIMTSIKVSSLNSQMLVEQANTRQQMAKVEELESSNHQLLGEIGRLEQERAQLVQGRIPRLLPLEFDVTVPIDERYFRNISFTLAGTAHDRIYEYHVVMHNEGNSNIRPNVTLFLFDELGIQVGKTRLSEKDATSGRNSLSLKPGETRSYSSEIELDYPAEPRYFLIDIK